MAEYDPFEGPFDLNPVSDPRLAEALQKRRRRLGRWLRPKRWYATNLLDPNPAHQSVQVTPLRGSWTNGPLLCAYLARPLGEIVVDGPQDYGSVLTRIDAAVEYWLELQLSVDEAGRAVCREATVRPRNGRLEAMPRPPVGELLRHIVGFVEQQPRPRARPTEALAEEAATVYLAAQHRPAQAVAEHFGWRDRSSEWFVDPARMRVRRVMKTAELKGWVVPTTPRRRRRIVSPG